MANREAVVSWVKQSLWCAVAIISTLLGPIYAAAPPTLGRITIPRVSSPPQLEDFLDMKPSVAWEDKLAKIDRFTQRTPSDGQPVSQRTEAYLGYDDKNLYAIFICFDSEPGKIRARLSRREDVFDDDSVELMLDTFHDHRRAYAFFSNPLAVQADALWTEGQEWDFSFDTVFNTEAKLTPEGFVVKMAIPFRSLRFASNDLQTWGILLDRDVRRNNESSFWPWYSSRIAGRLNQEGDATGLENISPGHSFQLIPYGIFRSFRDIDLRDLDHPTFTQRDAFGQIGLDAKAVVKDKFVLDATANPDFSQIESDDPQVTVNQRFEVQFPEKRPFFLENSYYFQTPIPLLFTRRIVDPQWGVRLTGKDGPWAVGMLVADDASPGTQVAPGDPLFGQHAYFAVGRVSRDLGNQSWLGVMFTDREEGPYFNRVGGIDGRFNLNSNWVAAFQGVVSSTLCSDTRNDVCSLGTYLAGPAAEVTLQREGRKLNYFMDYSDRSDGFRTFTGFDPQPDIHNVYQRVQYSFRPEGKHLISWGPQMEIYHTFDHEGNYLNSGYFPSLKTEFVGQTFQLLLRKRDGIAAAEGLRRPDLKPEIPPPHHRSRVQDQPVPANLIAAGLSLWHTDQLRRARRRSSIYRGTHHCQRHADGATQPIAAGRQHLHTLPAAQPAGSPWQPEQSHHSFQVELSVHEETFFSLYWRVQLRVGQPRLHVPRDHQEFQR